MLAQLIVSSRDSRVVSLAKFGAKTDAPSGWPGREARKTAVLALSAGIIFIVGLPIFEALHYHYLPLQLQLSSTSWTNRRLLWVLAQLLQLRCQWFEIPCDGGGQDKAADGTEADLRYGGSISCTDT